MDYIIFIEDCKCGKITREEFFKTCVPIFNMEIFNPLILDYNKELYLINNINEDNKNIIQAYLNSKKAKSGGRRRKTRKLYRKSRKSRKART